VDFAEFKQAIASPYFDTAYARQVFPDVSPVYLAVQTARWKKAGKLLALRRGLYVLAGANAPVPVLANRIVEPSYLSGLWALSFFGMIPEAVWEFTSACRVSPRRKLYITPLGRFSYRQVKFFGGYERLKMDRYDVLLATREKALLDTWYWAGGEWTAPRHREMRYQNMDDVRPDRLQEYMRRFDSPRMERAWHAFRRHMEQEPEKLL
jgi:predicted transcriptional regulator of viral defense system